MEPFSQYAVAAALEQWKIPGLRWKRKIRKHGRRYHRLRCGSLQATETNEKKLMEKVLQEWIRSLVPEDDHKYGAGNVSIATGAKGKCTNVVTACATGTHCIGDAFPCHSVW